MPVVLNVEGDAAMTLSVRYDDRGRRTVSRRRLSGALGALLLALMAAAPAEAQALRSAQLVGAWSGRESSLVGAMALQVVFFPDGRYQRVHRLGGLMTFDNGRYTIAQNWVHFELEQFGPDHFNGKPLTWPRSDTWIVHRFDGRFLEATIGGAQVSISRN
jgi:hypothetical protein